MGNIRSKIYITLPSSGETEVFPLYEKGSRLRYGWNKDNDIWRKNVDTKFTFVNGNGLSLFDIFAANEIEECGCHVFPMRIALLCGETETTLYTGSFFFIDGEWFFDTCHVDMKPRIEDPFTCLFKNWETEKNIIEIEDEVTLTT